LYKHKNNKLTIIAYSFGADIIFPSYRAINYSRRRQCLDKRAL